MGRRPPGEVISTLTVVKSGAGGDGASYITGLGIDCGSDCSESYPGFWDLHGQFYVHALPGIVLSTGAVAVQDVPIAL